MKLVSLFSPDYAVALKTLAYSLSEYGKVTGLDWVLICSDAPRYIKELVKPFGFNPVIRMISDFPKMPEFPNAKEHVRLTNNKLLFWLLEPGLYTSLDLDMYCKKDAREMLDFEHFSAERRPGADGFCAGLQTLQASERTYSEILQCYNEGFRLPDQDIVNAYFENRPELKILPWKWNTSRKEEYRQPNGKQLIKDAIFIHFHGPVKPWLFYSPRSPDSYDGWYQMYSESLGRFLY